MCGHPLFIVHTYKYAFREVTLFIVSRACAWSGPGFGLAFSPVPGTPEPKSELSLLGPVAFCVKQFLPGCFSRCRGGSFGTNNYLYGSVYQRCQTVLINPFFREKRTTFGSVPLPVVWSPSIMLAVLESVLVCTSFLIFWFVWVTLSCMGHFHETYFSSGWILGIWATV